MYRDRVLHPSETRESGVEEKREKETEREGEGKKCRQPNLLDIYNGQTGQLVTANLPTWLARQQSQKESEAQAATSSAPPPQPP